jgi:hypothetical protein
MVASITGACNLSTIRNRALSKRSASLSEMECSIACRFDHSSGRGSSE